jgi:hypothetical protein
MSENRQSPRNGLAKKLWDADPDESPQEISARKERFECTDCGWTAELRRNQCMVCEYDRPLQSCGASR